MIRVRMRVTLKSHVWVQELKDSNMGAYVASRHIPEPCTLKPAPKPAT